MSRLNSPQVTMLTAGGYWRSVPILLSCAATTPCGLNGSWWHNLYQLDVHDGRRLCKLVQLTSLLLLESLRRSRCA